MSKKVLVFGGGGQLGVELCREFERRQWEVRWFERQQLDITDAESVDAVIGSTDPQVVLNAAAYNQVDIAENEPLAAYQVNSLAVRNLAVACRQADARLVHYSTDYVFDGTKGSPYVETDTPHPIGAYGVSKLAGELYAQAYLDNALIIRTSGVFGPGGMFTPRGNFVELMLRLAQETKPIRVVRDFVASPTYAPAMAARTADMVEKNLQGVFHLGGGQAISWFDYAAMIFQLAGLSPALEPTSEKEHRTLARRPKFSALSNSKLEAAGIAPMPPLREALQEYLRAREHATSHRLA
ncbi:MAG TPA: dTDP-4-dehydrorhamnose reductase [Bryobacteraceae bacterium]|nr:dTDP-4-dehydrorhamnose reductase [Bryobacteraceae bacterium]